MMAKNFPEVMKLTKPKIQKDQGTPRQMNTRTHTYMDTCTHTPRYTF